MTDTMTAKVVEDGSLEDFRHSVRAWIAMESPDGLVDVFDWRSREIPGNWIEARHRAEQHPVYQEWERRCVAAGLVCASWPREAGGRGWSRPQKAVFEEELHLARVPRIDRGMGEFLVGPTIAARGTDEQKARLLPRIISGKDRYCQGFSEPDYGSDLGGLQTQGRVEGDELVISGQKVWTSGATGANMIFILCRTDPDAPKHRGITFAVVPFSEGNGFEIRPIRQLSGGAEFAEEFITEARTSLDNVIGGLGEGWSVTMTTLTFERDFNLPTLTLEFAHELEAITALARRNGRAEDAVARQSLAHAYSHVAIMRFFSQRMLADEANSGRIVSTTKLFWSEYHRWVTEEAMRIEGARALVRPDGDGYATSPVQDAFLAARAGTIYAGTSQIQRNIIAERVLGLPR